MTSAEAPIRSTAVLSAGMIGHQHLIEMLTERRSILGPAGLSRLWRRGARRPGARADPTKGSVAGDVLVGRLAADEFRVRVQDEARALQGGEEQTLATASSSDRADRGGAAGVGELGASAEDVAGVGNTVADRAGLCVLADDPSSVISLVPCRKCADDSFPLRIDFAAEEAPGGNEPATASAASAWSRPTAPERSPRPRPERIRPADSHAARRHEEAAG